MVMLKRHWVIWLLLAWLALVNGVMAAPSVAHADHHAAHQAGAHSTGLCAWLCAAGQMVDTIRPIPQGSVHLLAFNIPLIFKPSVSQLDECPTSRGPPAGLF